MSSGPYRQLPARPSPPKRLTGTSPSASPNTGGHLLPPVLPLLMQDTLKWLKSESWGSCIHPVWSFLALSIDLLTCLPPSCGHPSVGHPSVEAITTSPVSYLNLPQVSLPPPPPFYPPLRHPFKMQITLTSTPSLSLRSSPKSCLYNLMLVNASTPTTLFVPLLNLIPSNGIPRHGMNGRTAPYHSFPEQQPLPLL